MVALIGRGESRELVSIGIPVEVAAIDNTSAHLCGMAIHILRCGVGDNVTSPLKRTAVDRSGEGVVHDEWHTMLVGHLGEALYVKHIAARIAYCLAEEALGVGAELLLDTLVIPLWVDEGALDAELLHGDSKEVEGASIDCVACDEMVTSLTDIEDGVEVGCLSAGCEHCSYSTLECCYLLCHEVVGRIGQTSVEVAIVLEVEEARHLFACVVLECRALIDGELLWLTLGWFPSAMYADGF